MYTDSSVYYDLIYSFKDYQKESAAIIEMIKARQPRGRTVLDVGCGTAEHHKYLKEHYEIDGIDLNEQFIQIAATKNKHGNYIVADMRSFHLGKKYDVIICLFSSIGYLKSIAEIVLALRCFKEHLNPNGLIIVEPWFTPEQYHPGKIGMLSYDQPEMKICRMTQSARQNELSQLFIHYLLATAEKGIVHFEELHELRLTTVIEMTDAFQQAGLDANYDQQGLIGRGLYFGVNTTERNPG